VCANNGAVSMWIQCR